MDVFGLLLLKILALYVAIGLGFVAGKKLGTDKEQIGRLLFYMITPIVFLHGISILDIGPAHLLLPLILFTTSCILCLVFYRIGKKVFHDNTANLLALTSGNGNMGYFGVPVAMLLFNEQTVAAYMVMIIGVMVYESTLGYFMIASGQFSPREALRQTVRLPLLWGALGGLALSLLDIQFPPFLDGFWVALKGAYSILGLMMIGLGLAALTSFKLDWLFTGLTFSVKFIAWPLMMGGFVWLDSSYLGLFEPMVHQAFILISVVPLAVNSVVMATILKAHPEKMAAAVFLSTVFALFYVPLMVGLFIS